MNEIAPDLCLSGHETLRQRLDAMGPLSPDAASAMLDRIAEVVDMQHHGGRTVGVLPPEHVFLMPDGGVHLLIRRAGTDAPIAHSQGLRRHAIADVTHAASPEEARGEPHTPSTDLWLLGALVYETVTGRPPFAALRRSALLEQVALYDPDLLGGEATCFQDAMDRALAKWPVNRYPSAQAMANAFWASLPHPGVAPLPLVGAKSGTVTERPPMQLTHAAGRPLRLSGRASHASAAERTGGRRRILRLIQQMSPFGIADGGPG